MESSDAVSNKKISLEDLSKDELIKKCNNFLLIAKKAKQARDESSEELKKYKENDLKLSSDVAALKEVVESFNKKQSEFAEVQNKHKLSEEKNSELKKNFQKLEEKHAAKIIECSKLQETLKKLSDKISVLEISNSEYTEKVNDFKESYSKLDIENKINIGKLRDCQQNELDLRKKLQVTEDKYMKLELTLKEFQGKYLEECKNHEELQEMLTKLQNKTSSGRCSSRSSDSLKPVYENQEYDEILEKYNDLTEKNKLNILEIEKLNKKLQENERLVEEWSIKYNKILENSNKSSDNVNSTEIDELKEIVKEKDSKCEKLVSELNEKNKLLLNQDLLKNENEKLKSELKNLELLFNENMVQCDGLRKDLSQCQLALSSSKAEFDLEKAHYIEELDKMKTLLNEKTGLLQEKSVENQKLAETLSNLEESQNNFRIKLNEISEEYDKLICEESCDASSKSNADEADNEGSMKKLLDVENILQKLKKNYESVVLEKNKLIEIYESDKSAEEVFKQNITQLKQELLALREENVTADKKYKEMEQKLEESRIISELLKKEIDGKCDEYDAFKKEMDFYKKKNNELEIKVHEKETECNTYKTECENLKEAEKMCLSENDELKKSLNSTHDSLKNIEEKYKKLEEEFLSIDKHPHGSYVFEKFSAEDEKNYESVLEKYVKDNNKIDTSLIMKDLAGARLEIESLKENKSKENQYTQVDDFLKCETDIGENETSLEVTDGRSCKYREEELHGKISSLFHSVRALKDFKSEINQQVRDYFSSLHMDQIKITQDVCRSITNVSYNLQHGNSELLTEMNDMNKVLKERSGLISKLEKVNESLQKEILEANSKISHLDSKLAEKKNQMKSVFDELEEVKLEAEKKDKIIREMEEEIWKLKTSDSHGEVLSSSTLSRVEEAARLMDVEESFEDRYNKLKIIAVKLKKRVTELQKQLEEERNKAVSKNNELQTKITNFQSQIKSLMNLQAEYDRLQDLYEEERNDKGLLRKAQEAANDKIDSLKQEVDDMKKQRDKFLNEKTSFENVKKKLSAQIITLKSLIEEEKGKYMKLEKELEKSEYERALKEKKLEEEKEKHKATVGLLEKQKMETKNLGVLKLEITEYEKSVIDLEKKLSLREEEINDLQKVLEEQRSQCGVYLDEITHLKSQLTQENERATEANIQMRKFNEESSNREIEYKEKMNEIGALKLALEEKKKELEEMTLELANVSQEKLKSEEKCKNIQDHCSREIHCLQDSVANLQDSLSQKELEVIELKKEFDAYKIRAQSVLRQSQKEVNQSKQRNVMEELEQLRSTSESLKTRLEESGLKMQKLVEENEVFQEEKNRLHKRIQELKNSVAELRTENHELKESKQKEAENFEEALKLQKLQSETLAHCFQKKIEELQTDHKTEIDGLKKDYEQMQKQLQKDVLNANEKLNNENRRNSTNFIPVKPDKEILDVMLLEREECEGSESVNSISPQTGNNTNLIPLDQLLNSPDPVEQGEQKKSPVQDVNRLNDKLEKSENRIKHLTVLLSEAETDCARLQQLNDILKEEIRRNQRNIEREQHAQNFEYMKNVVLKFITLHSSDEKVRLVPVLNTILKLSPEEENILANAAKGIADSNSNRGWGSYLNIWPSAQ